MAMSGFTFGGVHSDAFDLLVNKKSVPLTPEIKNRLQEIAGFDGAWDFGTSFGTKEIEIECTIMENSTDSLKSIVRQLAGFFNPQFGSRELIFDDDPKVMYRAKLSNQIPLEQIGMLGTFTLQFTCSDPFTYSVDERTEDVSNGGLVIHNGAHIAHPTFTVTKGEGEATLKITHADNTVEVAQFTPSSPSGTYTIDSKEKTITREGRGAYDDVLGDFPSLFAAENQIEVSGAIESVQVKFRDTWL